jgi:esterase/lipase superfamily enzyme
VEYENYILREVMPLTRAMNGNPYMITAGASFGAYHALNLALRHPHLVGRVLALSGFYDIGKWTDGFVNDTVYFNNPSAYLSNEHDPYRLGMLQNLDIIMTTGQNDPGRDNTQYISGVLWQKGVGNALRVWDGFGHDWPWWQQQLQMYIGGSD